MVPPSGLVCVLICFLPWASMKLSIRYMIGFLHSLLNSIEFASSKPKTSLANSIIASCIPRQIPRYGILFSRANFMACILPKTPLSPKPPATKMPSTSFKSSFTLLSSIFSLSIQRKFTLASKFAPAWMMPSVRLL